MSITTTGPDVVSLRVEGLRKELGARQGTYNQLDAYYEGIQRLEQLGLAVPPELRRFVTIVNWPRLAVDAVEERLDVEGFRYADEDEADDELWRVWQANDLDEESQLGHLDALIFGRSFVCVGSNEGDKETPLITVESPREMTVTIDPRTRKVSAALRVYGVDSTGKPTKATLYQPDQTLFLEQGTGGWTVVDADEHRLGMVPVVPLVNRPRTSSRSGISELADVAGLTDACARALTNAQVASEALAVPQRWALGVSKGDFVDQEGNPLPVWQAYFGAVWSTGSKKTDAEFGQFDAADLSNFETIVNLYARLVASLTGLPPHYLGFTTDNPASADAIRSSEARLVKRCERKQRAFSGSWEQVMRLVRKVQGQNDPGAKSLETLWRDPATPTTAQRADAVMKLASTTVGGVPIMPLDMAREELGWSATRRNRARRMDEEMASDPTMLRLMRDLAGDAPVSS